MSSLSTMSHHYMSKQDDQEETDVRKNLASSSQKWRIDAGEMRALPHGQKSSVKHEDHTARPAQARQSSCPTTEIVKLRWRAPVLKPRARQLRRSGGTRRDMPQDSSLEREAAKATSTVVQGSPKPLLLSSKTIYRLAQWWFCTPGEGIQEYKAALTHWVTAGWDIVRRSDFFMECISLYTARKVSHLQGRFAPYVTQKSRVMQHINTRLSEKRGTPEELTLVGIGILAYCSLLDGELEAAKMHLIALQTAGVSRRLRNAREEWLYVFWVDLRFSLFHSSAPLLDYCVPVAYRSSLELDMSNAWIKAHAAMLESPFCQQSGLITSADIFDLWVKVFTLAELYSGVKTNTPPFGLLYDVEYRLRVLQARALQSIPTETATGAPSVACLRLLLASIQATTWIVSRFWAPASPGSRRFLVMQAHSTLATIPQLDEAWSCAGGRSGILEWTLRTLSAFGLEDGFKPHPLAIRLLRQMSGVETTSAQFHKWLGVEHWHTAALAQLHMHVGEGAPLPTTVPRSTPFYLGAVEFY